MYFIVNITRPPEEVYIKDLDFRLGPNKALDLEKVRSRKDIDSSGDLKSLVKKRKVQLRHTFRSRAKAEDQPSPKKKGLDEDDIKQITQAVAGELKEHLHQQSDSSSIPTELVDVLRDLKDTINKPQSSESTQSPQQPSESISVIDREEDLDLDTLSDIHARAVSRRSKQSSSGKISYEENDTDSNASSRADELGDLL